MNFLLQQVLLDPATAVELEMQELGQLTSQARVSSLLPTLAARLGDAAVLDQLPQEAQRHFRSALSMHDKQRRDLTYECGRLRRALMDIGERVVLLKGAAYLQSGLIVGAGRMITDIDILVPRARIDAAEKALNAAGWESSPVDAYDERYYRRWSHEIPALIDPRRDSTIDLHHSILPPTTKSRVNPDLLFDELVQIGEGTYCLSPRDMVIHSSTHLFHEGEFHHGLRDLWDLDRMLRDFSGRRADFWDSLLPRAKALDLELPLYYALRYCQQVFDTPVPAEVFRRASSVGLALRAPVMDVLFRRAFRPSHSSCRLSWTSPALFALYLRSHYLRMPWYMLLPHLARKTWMRGPWSAAKRTLTDDGAAV